MNAYSEEYLKKWKVIEEHYFTKSDPYAKQTRDRRARQLRKEGYIVECEKWDFPDFGTGSMYTLEAKRLRTQSELDAMEELYEKLLAYDENEKPVCFGCFGYPSCSNSDECIWVKRCKGSQEDY